MLKIMLIDDEVPFRTRMKEMINWRQLGYEIVAEAANGKLALESIEIKQPDILILDMNMPVMNGAELIESVSLKWPKIKVIGLSGYDDYDYLRITMRSGAVDYLLKHNLTSETLLAAIDSAAQAIIKEEQAEAFTAKLENQIEEHKEVLQRNFIMNLLEGNLGYDELSIHAQMDSLTLDLPLHCGSIILMLIDQLWRIRQNSDEATLSTVIGSLKSIAADILREYQHSSIYQLDERTFIIFMPAGSQRSVMAAVDKQRAAMGRISTSLLRYLNLSVSFCAGAPYHELEGLIYSYEQVRALMDEHFYDGIGSMRFAGHSPVNTTSSDQMDSISLDIEVEKRLASAIQNADEASVEQTLNTYFSNLYVQRASNKSFKIICIELIHLLGRTVRDLSAASDNNSYDPLDAYDRINRFDTMDDLKNWIIEKYIETVVFIRLHGLHERYSPVVSKALQFIQNSFNDQISLGEAAEYAGVSNSYLSRSFKDETGKGFSEYVTNCRIEHACKLIRVGGHRIKDVANDCGFQNYTYFFKVFKQITGLTPNEYEAEIKRNSH